MTKEEFIRGHVVFRPIFPGERQTIYSYLIRSMLAALLVSLFLTGCLKEKGSSNVEQLVPEKMPPSGFLTINEGAGITKDATVTLSLHAADADGVTHMQVSNDPNAWQEPEDYAATKGWTLPSGDGLKHVYARYRDNRGNWSSVCSAAIFLGEGLDFEFSCPGQAQAGYTLRFVLTFYNASPVERVVERIVISASLPDEEVTVLDRTVLLPVPGRQEPKGKPVIVPEKLNVVWSELPASLRNRMQPGSTIRFSTVAYMRKGEPLIYTHCGTTIIVP